MTLLFLTLDEIPVPPAREAAWLEELPAARRMQLQSWPDVRARHRSLLGSRLLREGLQRLGLAADAMVGLRYPALAKPTLDLPLDFSLAHCEGRILCALSTAGPVGVDVEPLGSLRAAGFKLYLSAAERAWAGEDAQRFYELWTRKEAVAKAAGTGGLRRMGEFEMVGNRADHAGLRWYTVPLEVGSGYVAQLARLEDLPAPPVQRIAPETLL